MIRILFKILLHTVMDPDTRKHR